ncbi:Transcription factor EB, partial [Taenia solium]
TKVAMSNSGLAFKVVKTPKCEIETFAPQNAMNPTATHNSELKSTTYSLVPTTATSAATTSELIPMGQQRPPSYGSSGGGARFHDSSASFAPLVTVDTTGGTDFPDYFSPTASTASSSFNAPSAFNSHHSVQSTYASLISETDLYAGRQLAQPHLSYVNSAGGAPSLQRFIGGLTNKLPDLQCTTGGNMDVAYPTPHMVGLAASPHASLISPAYSPSSVTTQGSGGGGGGSCKRTVLDADSKPGAFKSRSKKESHNRIERRRRDYINSQITRLSGLLPADMYRDVDGRRNKGTVLRLSVNYILELRQAVAHTASLRQETAIARQLIPLLLNHIQSLESVIKEVEMSTGKPLGGGGQGAPSLLEDGGRAPESAAYEAVLEAWRTAMTTNLARAAAVAAMNNNSGENPQEGKIESSEMPLMSNMQVTFVGRPPTTTTGAVASPYLPNAIFMGGPVCKLEEGEEVCYGSGGGGEMASGGSGAGANGGHMVVGGVPHATEGTTDSFFDSTNATNNSSSGVAPKFDLSIMQMASTGGADCGDPMQVECQNH